MIYSTLLLLIFMFASTGGFFLIRQQISLVKAEIFSIQDYFKCIIYGFIFGSGILIIVSMMVIYAINDPLLKIPNPNSSDLYLMSRILIIPIIYLMIFLYSFPLLDFLKIAHSDQYKGMTAFQEYIGEKIIRRLPRPNNYLLAVLSWLVIFILPPILFYLIGNVPIIIATISWSIAIPIMIINFFGIRGYVNGIVENYNNISLISRNSFLGFDKSNRGLQEFKDGPFYRIMLGLMIFLYFWTLYSLIQTASTLTGGQIGPSNMQYSWSVFLVLLFGITGYFSRFWGRKVKFRWMDILFAAWLIACVGINVMINFLIPNNTKLNEIFNLSAITIPIITGTNYKFFVPSAIIEESIIVFLITYYILGIKNDFFKKSKYAYIDKASQNFNPIPLFNLIRVSNSEIKNHAKEGILKMYGRIPNKKEYNLLDDKFMNPLFDALSDYNEDSCEIANKILENYIIEHPRLIYPKIIEALESYNYDKKLGIAKVVLKHPESIIEYIPISTLEKLAVDKDYNVRRFFLNLISRSTKKCQEIKKSIMIGLLRDPDFEIQIKTLDLVNQSKVSIESEYILEKFNSLNKRVKTAAILSLKDVQGAENSKEFRKMMKSFKEMLFSSDTINKISAMNTLSKIGNFRKNKIPYDPYIEGINSQNNDLRDASKNGLIVILEESQSKDERNIAIALINNALKSDNAVKLSILKVLNSIKGQSKSHLIPFLMQTIRSEVKEIQKLSSEMIIEMVSEDVTLVLEEILKIKEEKTFLKKGIIEQTVLGVYKKNPEILSNIITFLTSTDEITRINSANIIAGIAEISTEKVDISKIFNRLDVETSSTVKKSLLNVLSYISLENPNKLSIFIDKVTSFIADPDSGIGILANKILIPISKVKPESISLDLMIELTKKKDSIIQESAIKIIGHIGIRNIEKSFDFLKGLLKDDNWTVKNSAIEAIYQLGLTSKDIRAINKIMELLDDNEKWTKIKALDITSKIIGDYPNLLPLEKLKSLIESDEPEIRISVAKIIGSLNQDNFKDIFPLIIKLMSDSEQRVREQSSSALVSISKSISMKDLLPVTLKYFSDDIDIVLQQSMAISLEKIIKYESKEIRKRVGDLLKIRCEISQDPIICKIAQDLLE